MLLLPPTIAELLNFNPKQAIEVVHCVLLLLLMIAELLPNQEQAIETLRASQPVKLDISHACAHICAALIERRAPAHQPLIKGAPTRSQPVYRCPSAGSLSRQPCKAHPASPAQASRHAPPLATPIRAPFIFHDCAGASRPLLLAAAPPPLAGFLCIHRRVA